MKPLWAVAGAALLGAAGAGTLTAAYVVLPRDEEVGFGDSDAQAVSQADFVVTTTVDTVDAAPGDGACATAEGECSLRAAVQESNALAGAQSVGVPPGQYVLRIPGQTDDVAAAGDLDITDDLVITGQPEDTRIDGGRLDPVFQLALGVTVAMTGIIIENGADVGNEPSLPTRPLGGAGILNFGQLTLADSVVRDNTANGPGREGGGIINGGTLRLIDVTVEGNSTGGGGGAIRNGGTLFIGSSTIRGNRAGGDGGGVTNSGDNNVTIYNTTITENSACSGGGLSNYGFDDQMHINNTTIVNNRAEGTYSAVCNGGGISNYAGIVNIRSTLIANNTDAGGEAPDCMTGVYAIQGLPLTSHGYNLIGDLTGCALKGLRIGDVIGRDPLIDVLSDNGGPTQTHALLQGSPAIDAGAPGAPGSGPGSCEPADQRGVARPLGNACDIGAFESAFAAAPTPVVTPAPVEGLPRTGDPGDHGTPPLALVPAAAMLVGIVAPSFWWAQRMRYHLKP